MAMKDAAALLLTELATITSPTVPSSVAQVPPGHGDNIPKGANITSWINLEPDVQERSDEPNRSGLRQYPFTAWYWVSDKHHRLGDASDVLMDMQDAILDVLQHNTLGGWARSGIASESFDVDMGGGDDDDTLYVVKVGFVVWKQEPPAEVLWTPAELSPALWYDCTDPVLDASGNVYMFTDLSGYNRHAIQTTANLRPAYTGGVPVFNGTSHCLTLFGPVTLDVTEGMTVVQVFNRATAGIFSHILVHATSLYPFAASWQSTNTIYSGLSPSQYATHGASTATGDYISVNRRNATKVRLWHNGTEVGTEQTAGTLTGSKTITGIAKYGGLYYHKGIMYSLVVVSSEVSDADRQKLEGYMAHTYGMTSRLPADHPYKTTQPYV